MVNVGIGRPQTNICGAGGAPTRCWRAAKHSMAVTRCASGRLEEPENWAARNPNTRLVIGRL
jgi:hypothetical protein